MAALLSAAEDSEERAAQFFGASAALRDALGETLGGVRVVADEVRRSRDRLESALGSERFAEHEARGRASSTDEALADALAALADSPSH
jgi:hypothetical protein